MTNADRRRVAELTSGVGALVLGVGLGALLGERLSGLGLSLLVLGAASHAWGMFDKRRTDERKGPADVWWVSILYWTCWALLAFGAAVVLGRFLDMR